MNKKGDVFMMGLNILFLVAFILVFWKLGNEFASQNSYEGMGTRQTALMTTYAVSEQMLLYIDTAATFAAYEALDTMADKGILKPSVDGCGSYASYKRWTKEGGSCIVSREGIDGGFSVEFNNRLRSYWVLPGLPADISYLYTVIHSSAGLRVIGTTDDEIVLPILTAKKTLQEHIASLLFEENIASVRKGTFIPDYKPADVRPSLNKEPRTSAIADIVVLSTKTAHVTDSFFQYEQMGDSVHYVIDKEGSVTQIVREQERALCCADESISIALVNQLEHKGDCLEGEKNAQGACWEYYTELQLGNLSILAANIVERYGMRPENVRLHEEMAPGPLFNKEDLIKGIITAEEAPEKEDDTVSSFVGVWPVDEKLVSSCFGPRPYLNDPMHWGVDLPGNKKPVYAFAKGKVLTIGSSNSAGIFIRIEHENGLISAYNHLDSTQKRLREGDEVLRGQPIGFTGNTGYSTGPHLDFKVYKDGLENPATNPLCFFSDGELQELRFNGRNCEYEIPLTQTDTTWERECSGLPRYETEDVAGCVFDTPVSMPEGNADATETKKRLKDVMHIIENSMDEYGVDPRLVMAIITVESTGRADIVNSNHAVGLGQIRPDAAIELKDILGPFKAECKCSSGTCVASSVPVCKDDPRLIPEKAVRAIPAYLNILEQQLKNKGHNNIKDYNRIIVGSYNQGAGGISKAMKASRIANPTWEDIEPYVKEEGQNYVRKVMAAYAAFGGSEGTSLSDQFCGDSNLLVKQLGTYTFKPNFVVEIPDSLSPYANLMEWAEETYSSCDGSSDNRECLREREKVSVGGVEFVGCGDIEGNNFIGVRYRSFRTDCENNKQSDCTCDFYPHFNDVDMHLYGEVGQVYVGGVPTTEAPSVSPYSIIDDKERLLSLRVSKGQRQFVTWLIPAVVEGTDVSFEEENKVTDVDMFRLLKDDMAWSTDTDLPVCGVYKKQHQVCAKITTPTYSLSSNEQKDPIVKFALYLEDDVIPEAVEDAKAVEKFPIGSLIDSVVPGVGSVIVNELTPQPVVVTFSPSPSDDVSYYYVSCDSFIDDKEKILARSVNADGFDTLIDEEFSLDLICIASVSGKVTITPYDISGNEGESVSVAVESLIPSVGDVA